jgi:hypothetical protein
MALSETSSGSSPGPTPKDLRWWPTKDFAPSKDGDETARRVFAAATAIINNSIDREETIWRNIRMYNGQTREAYWGDTSQNPLSLVRNGESSPYKVNRNVVASVVDTMVSTLTATPIKTTVLASGGSYSRTRKRSKIAEKYCNGVKYNNEFELLGPEALLSACVADLGIIKVEEDPDNPGNVKLETVFAAELVVDTIDGMYKKPRQIMQRKAISRDVLKEMYSEVDDLSEEQLFERIDGLPSIGSASNTQAQLADKVEVLEAWHLASGPEAHDGYHVICIENTTLFAEEWTLHRFPFAFLRPNLQLFGFWGSGIASDLVGTQYEINKLSQKKQRALELGSNFMVMVPSGSRVNKNHIVNGMGLMLEYTGEAPTWFTPSPVSPDIKEEIQGLMAYAFQRWGISELASHGEKPAGMESGEALRTFAKIESIRHSTLGKQYQRFCLDVDALILFTARMIDQRMKAEAKKTDGKKPKAAANKMTVRVPDKQHIEHIDWADADPGDGFITKLYATNLLADSPADRLEQVMAMAERGKITSEEMFSLLDFPDLEVFNKLRNAPRDNILKQIDDILIDGKYRAPEPFQNLQLGLQLFQSALLEAEDNGAEEDRLAMLQRWMGEAQVMLQAAMPPPPAPAPMGPPMPPPGAGPGAPPPPMPPMPPMPPPGPQAGPQAGPPPGAPPMPPPQ